jgi:hypothetical protein
VSADLKVSPISPAMKRRKVRKGTFSCWECRQRKKRCEFKTPSSDICLSCKRHGTSCIRQEFKDPVDRSYEEVERRIVHVESLVGKVVQQRRVHQPECQDNKRIKNQQLAYAKDTQMQSPASSLSQLYSPLTTGQSLSSYLHSTLPPPSTATMILSYGGSGQLPVHVLSLPKQQRVTLNSSSQSQGQITTLPSPTAHPLQFARTLIMLALCLQQLDSASTLQHSSFKLNASAKDTMHKYINIVSSYVTSQDSLMESLDGLEVLMLEAIFQLNQGNLRSSWLLFRRCIAVSQLIGLPDTPGDREQRIWSCFIYADRTLSLMLGLPFAILEHDFTSGKLLTADTPTRGLESLHVVLVERIISRNIRIQRRRRNQISQHRLQSEAAEYQETLYIDSEFKKAARLFPAIWWDSPSLDGLPTDPQTMEKTAALLLQMHHHYYLVSLHQPYLIDDADAQDHSYSKSVIPLASRDMLSRFLIMRNFYITPTYRGLDDKAVTAAVALLLAHFEGHRLGRANVLEHQRPRDLALIDQTICTMEKACGLYENERSESYVKLLKMLVAVEEEVAHGTSYYLSLTNNEFALRKEQGIISIPLPYFGTICITRTKPSPPISLTPDACNSGNTGNMLSATQSQPWLLDHSSFNDALNFGVQDLPQVFSLEQTSASFPNYLLDIPDLLHQYTDPFNSS